MSASLVSYEKTQSTITITINNPPVNAVSTKVLHALNEAFERAEGEKDARCIIFTGAGDRHFAREAIFAKKKISATRIMRVHFVIWAERPFSELNHVRYL